jgi:hypothetical protein
VHRITSGLRARFHVVIALQLREHVACAFLPTKANIYRLWNTHCIAVD